MQFTSNVLEVIDWERKLTIADENVTWHCRLIGGSARETIFRVDAIAVCDILTIDIGGGPASYVKVPFRYDDYLCTGDLEMPLSIIAQRILGSDNRLSFEFAEEPANLKWWQELEAADCDFARDDYAPYEVQGKEFASLEEAEKWLLTQPFGKYQVDWLGSTFGGYTPYKVDERGVVCFGHVCCARESDDDEGFRW